MRPVYVVTAGGTATRALRQEHVDAGQAVREAALYRTQLDGLEGARVGITDPYGVERAEVYRRGAWQEVA